MYRKCIELYKSSFRQITPLIFTQYLISKRENHLPSNTPMSYSNSGEIFRATQSDISFVSTSNCLQTSGKGVYSNPGYDLRSPRAQEDSCFQPASTLRWKAFIIEFSIKNTIAEPISEGSVNRRGNIEYWSS